MSKLQKALQNPAGKTTAYKVIKFRETMNQALFWELLVLQNTHFNPSVQPVGFGCVGG
jgi:hypothetical protein